MGVFTMARTEMSLELKTILYLCNLFHSSFDTWGIQKLTGFRTSVTSR